MVQIHFPSQEIHNLFAFAFLRRGHVQHSNSNVHNFVLLSNFPYSFLLTLYSSLFSLFVVPSLIDDATALVRSMVEGIYSICLPSWPFQFLILNIIFWHSLGLIHNLSSTQLILQPSFKMDAANTAFPQVTRSTKHNINLSMTQQTSGISLEFDDISSAYPLNTPLQSSLMVKFPFSQDMAALAKNSLVHKVRSC
jgi:hypothetical protein